MKLMKTFGVLLGLIATTLGQGQSFYPGPSVTSQQVLYPPSQFAPQGQQAPWSWQSFPNFPSYPYQYQFQQTLPPYPVVNGFPYYGQYPQGLFQPTVEITSPVIKEVDVIKPPAIPVPVPMPNIVPVSNMEASLLELENQGKLHAEKYYYGRSDMPFFPGMVPSYPPLSSTVSQYQYYEIPKYPGIPYQTFYPQQPSTIPTFPYPQQYLLQPQSQPQQTRFPTRPTDPIPQQNPSGGPDEGALEGGPGGSGGNGEGPGIPISPLLKPNQQLDPNGRPFTVNKRKHMEVYEYS